MKNPFLKYFILCLLIAILTQITNSVLNFDKLLYNSLAEKLTNQQVDKFLDYQNKWSWLSYVFIPVFILVKSSLIACIIYIGVFFFSKNEINYNSIWNIVLKAEFIFLLIPIFKIIWFYYFKTTYNLEDFQYYFPLSALNIIEYKSLESWFLYPLQILNLFELSYIIYLGYQIGKITNTNTDYGLKIIGYSYIPSIILWVVVVMFFTLNYS